MKHGVDEAYELQVLPVIDNDAYVVMTANTVYGVLRGFQTLLQLLEYGWQEEEDDDKAIWILPDAPIHIMDAPAYPYRGLLIDTSRHYLPLNLILLNLDAMEINKMNVLHWHLTDSQSWPFESERYPELSRRGAYCVDCIYSKDDIQTVIQQAVDRGIRVILEVDLPGHSQGKLMACRVVALWLF